VLFYAFIHFLWHSWDAVQEWRIRITGTKRLSHMTTFGDAECDYPNDPRQSSLMQWWTREARRLSEYSNLINKLKAGVKNLDDAVKSKDLGEFPNLHSVISQLNSTLLHSQHVVFKETKETIESQRIPESLHRFEKWFRRFSWFTACQVLFAGMGLANRVIALGSFPDFPVEVGTFSPMGTL
jgi:hypothetical protein